MTGSRGEPDLVAAAADGGEPAADDVLQVSRIHFPVTALGPGRRVGIWVQGCSIGCTGCISQDTWDPAGGRSWSIDEVVMAVAGAVAGGCCGVTISGGEPFEQSAALACFVGRLRSLSSGSGEPLDLLCYSGFSLKRLQRCHVDILAQLDAVITGPYVRTRPTDLVWRGSENQVLTPLSALGRKRYAAAVNGRTSRPVIQVSVDEGVWMVGIPRLDDLGRVEARLAAAGVRLNDVSWRS